jgi:nucleotide-binding universal stress UspA family protein
MFRNVLVPVDFTDANLPALKIAADLARADGGQVHLLHVIQTIPGLSADEEAGFYRRLEESAKRQVTDLGSRPELSGTRWKAGVVLGSRVGEILRSANDQEIDLIVLSSHRVGLADGTRGWSTLSYQVAVLARCPVLLVK